MIPHKEYKRLQEWAKQLGLPHDLETMKSLVKLCERYLEVTEPELRNSLEKQKWENRKHRLQKGEVAISRKELGDHIKTTQAAIKQIDDVMASSSAFRGVREGQETRGGRLALIDQSFLRLNEFVQVVDYLDGEIVDWFMQLGKLFFTEGHIAKIIGPNDARETIELTRDDFEDGVEVRIIAGKSLPEDRQFKYDQAQKDIDLGILSKKD